MIDDDNDALTPIAFDVYSEYCAPVVLTFASAEVEKICLKNGLLFHELLRYALLVYLVWGSISKFLSVACIIVSVVHLGTLMA
jgi:hypothetical protein